MLTKPIVFKNVEYASKKEYEFRNYKSIENLYFENPYY